MKKLIFLSLFLPLFLFGQEETVSSKRQTYIEVEYFLRAYFSEQKDLSTVENIVDSGVEYVLRTYYLSYGNKYLSESHLLAKVYMEIVELEVGNKSMYFLALEDLSSSSIITTAEKSYPTHNAYIKYSDLVEINKFLSQVDTSIKSDMENKEGADIIHRIYTTKDNFRISYKIENDKISWYVCLNTSHPNTTTFLCNEKIIKLLANAEKEMKEIMNKDIKFE